MAQKPCHIFTRFPIIPYSGQAPFIGCDGGKADHPDTGQLDPGHRGGRGQARSLHPVHTRRKGGREGADRDPGRRRARRLHGPDAAGGDDPPARGTPSPFMNPIDGRRESVCIIIHRNIYYCVS